MKPKDKIKLRRILDFTWPGLELYISVMATYLQGGKITKSDDEKIIFKLMIACLTAVVGELYTNDKYAKYQSKNYTEEDFVDMVIESIGHKFPNKNDREGIIEYVENFRSILWGYARHHCKEYLELYEDLNEIFVNDSSFSFLRECMTIVTVESGLKSLESKIQL